MPKTNVKDFLQKEECMEKGSQVESKPEYNLLEYPTNNMIINCIGIWDDYEENLN